MNSSEPAKKTSPSGKLRSSLRKLLSGFVGGAASGQDHAAELIHEQHLQIAVTTVRGFAVLLLIEWLAALLVALVISPRAWDGAGWSVHEHVWAALGLGGAIVVPALLCVYFRPGALATRLVVASAQMLMSALLIHLTGGRIETHFLVFGSLAFLAFYRDWLVLLTATVVIAADHVLRGLFYPESVYGSSEAPLWRAAEHAFWVLFEDFFLLMGIWRGNRVQRSVTAGKIRELGQYHLKERLGGGGMGEVYLAEHRLLKRPCAVKLIRPDKAHDVEMLRRFEREVRSTARLTHPNTVGIYDYGHMEDGTFYYVMEYLNGSSLMELVERHGPLPPARVVYLLRQVCGALREAHGLGLIHRDIKPDNVLVTRQGGRDDVAKLLDFGLVRTVADENPASRLTQAGTILGTPEYMAPEQVSGGDLDGRTDLYSLGATAYFTLVGRPPFQGKNALASMVARLQQQPESLTRQRPEIPSDVEQVVLRCLAVAPEDRFPDAKSMEKALAACSCAGAWDEERAAEFWQRTAAGSGTGADSPGVTAPFPQVFKDTKDDSGTLANR